MIVQTPAFPISFKNMSNDAILDPYGEPIPPSQTATYTGLTFFEYAAIAAMQGLLASDQGMRISPGDIAYAAVEQAKAMAMELGHVKE